MDEGVFRTIYQLFSCFPAIRITHCGGLIRYFHPRVNHNAHLNYSCEPILFMSGFFPCHLKVRWGCFSGRNRAVKAAPSDGDAFIFHTGWWSLGTPSSGSADEPYYLYITSICWELEPFSYVKHFRHYLGKFTKLNILVDPRCAQSHGDKLFPLKF